MLKRVESRWKVRTGVISDRDLVGRILGGETDLYEEVVQRHYNKAFAICFAITANREDSNDLVQEAFLKCYERLDRIVHPERLGAYIATTARHMALNLLKQRRYAHDHQMSIIEQNKGAEPVHVQSEDSEMREAIRKLLGELPEKTREVVSLYYFDDLQTPEIAELVGASPEAVRKRLEYGRNALKAAMEREIRPAIQTDDERRDRISGILGVVPLSTTPWGKISSFPKRVNSPRSGSTVFKAIGVATPLVLGVLLVYFGFPTVARFLGLQEGEADQPSQVSVQNVDESATTSRRTATVDGEAGSANAKKQEILSSSLGTTPRPIIRIGPPPMTFSDVQVALLKAAAQSVTQADACDIAIQPEGALGDEAAEDLDYSSLGNVLFITDRNLRGSALLARYIADRAIISLDEMVNDPDFAKDDFYSNLWNSCVVDGSTWAVPLYATSWALGVNADAMQLDVSDNPYTRFSERLEFLAEHTSSCDPTRVATSSILSIPQDLMFDSYYLDAGGDYGAARLGESTAWKRAQVKTSAMKDRCSSIFSFPPTSIDDVADTHLTYITDGAFDPGSYRRLKANNPAWVLIAPMRTVPVPHSFFAVAVIRRTNLEEERIAWHLIKAILSPDIMYTEYQKYGITPIRESVAQRMSDPEEQIFVHQLKNMIFPPPVAREASDLEALMRSQ